MFIRVTCTRSPISCRSEPSSRPAFDCRRVWPRSATRSKFPTPTLHLEVGSAAGIADLFSQNKYEYIAWKCLNAYRTLREFVARHRFSSHNYCIRTGSDIPRQDIGWLYNIMLLSCWCVQEQFVARHQFSNHNCCIRTHSDIPRQTKTWADYMDPFWYSQTNKDMGWLYNLVLQVS